MHNLKIFTDNIDDEAKNQIQKLLDQEAFKDSKIRIMPDVHAGSNCVIGFTGDLGEKVIPNIVGNDIGCGMLCVNLGNVDIDYKKLDEFINMHIPSGKKVNEEKQTEFDLTNLLCYEQLRNVDFIERSIGTLGDGNHFIEIDTDNDNNKYLVIHTGSRNLGAQVAKYYQRLAVILCERSFKDYQKMREELIAKLKEQQREKEIEKELKALSEKNQYFHKGIPQEYAYLEGKYREAYLHDMKICQEYAELNRFVIAKKITEHMGWPLVDYFESVHNYISFEDNIVRKGAISAKKGEKVIIPISMKDGCILGAGKGNIDWNNSAPHGAGRKMSRKKAQESINLESYIDIMKNIYTSSVNENTIDESPFAYKSIQDILDNISPTVEITNLIKPVYNYKASDKEMIIEPETKSHSKSNKL